MQQSAANNYLLQPMYQVEKPQTAHQPLPTPRHMHRPKHADGRTGQDKGTAGWGACLAATSTTSKQAGMNRRTVVVSSMLPPRVPSQSHHSASLPPLRMSVLVRTAPSEARSLCCSGATTPPVTPGLMHCCPPKKVSKTRRCLSPSCPPPPLASQPHPLALAVTAA